MATKCLGSGFEKTMENDRNLEGILGWIQKSQQAKLRLLGSMLYTLYHSLCSYTCFFSGRRNIQELKPQISLPFEGFTEAHRKEGIPWNP